MKSTVTGEADLYCPRVSDVSDSKEIQAVGSEPGCEGASLLEYMLLASLIAFVCILGVVFLGQQASMSFSEAGAGLCGPAGC